MCINYNILFEKKEKMGKKEVYDVETIQKMSVIIARHIHSAQRVIIIQV